MLKSAKLLDKICQTQLVLANLSLFQLILADLSLSQLILAQLSKFCLKVLRILSKSLASFICHMSEKSHHQRTSPLFIVFFFLQRELLSNSGGGECLWQLWSSPLPSPQVQHSEKNCHKFKLFYHICITLIVEIHPLSTGSSLQRETQRKSGKTQYMSIRCRQHAVFVVILVDFDKYLDKSKTIWPV